MFLICTQMDKTYYINASHIVEIYANTFSSPAQISISYKNGLASFETVRVANFTYTADKLDDLILRINQG